MGRAGWTDDWLQTMPQKACSLPNTAQELVQRNEEQIWSRMFW